MGRISTLFAMIALSFLVLPIMYVKGQDQQPTLKFRRVENPIPNQYIVVLDDDTPFVRIADITAELTRTHGGSVSHVYPVRA